MTKSIRLSDLQLVLLATAAQRDNGSLLPPPDTLDDSAARIRKAVEALIRRHLAEEVELATEANAWRTEDGHAIGVVITDAGRAAIGLTAAEATASPDAASSDPTPATASPAAAEQASGPSAHTKSAMVLEMLRRASGATLDELTSATSWLPHTTRAALTGLRKKGHTIEKRKRGEVTCYHLGSQA
jgi:hypothetical protein